MSSFVRGTLFLMFVIFLSKLFGFFYRMQFMRIAGEEAVGIYMTAYPAFIFFLSLIQLGLPIAVAKIVAELLAQNKRENILGVMRTAILWSFIGMIVFMPLLALTIPFISTTLLHNEQTTYTLWIALFAVPVAVGSGLLRAYLQGVAKISPTAWAQMIEQAVRIGFITFMLPFVASYNNAAVTAASAMGITLLAEVVAFLYLWLHYTVSKKRLLTRKGEVQSYPATPMLRIAIPSAGSKLFGSFTWFLEPIIFLKALTMAGLSASAATILYGVISGVLVPLLLFPAFVSVALSIVLIPAVSDAVARKHNALLQERVSVSLRLSSLVGCVAATYFFIHGDELAVNLFHLDENRGYIKILAPIFYFYYIQSPLHSILQAIGEARAAMMNSIYGGLGKLFVMFVLASQPGIQEKGAVVAIGFGVLMTSFLHIATVRQRKNLRAGFRMFVVPYSCFIAVCIAQYFLMQIMPLPFILSSCVTLFLLFTFLLVSNQLRFSDLRYIRKLAKRV
ncbi:stage V sporulation protein B [Lysinibacillus contaminans]|uniref:Stage V sporulation protein B n=1 Tax=Lysinibacillus contaminans TaxID=1293441 RepID=A0ABR5JZ06_9BACI|nr:oligosaccharide flippase family protein [Lysinibacillus contaminans]KOS67879.1 stage V sporulation protein B [Lysinibacillus contaminans]